MKYTMTQFATPSIVDDAEALTNTLTLAEAAWFEHCVNSGVTPTCRKPTPRTKVITDILSGNKLLMIEMIGDVASVVHLCRIKKTTDDVQYFFLCSCGETGMPHPSESDTMADIDHHLAEVDDDTEKGVQAE